MSTARAVLMRRARRYLSIWMNHIGLDNELGLTDINAEAEDFCCGLLNIVLDARLQNLNLLQMNFPAIDLADGEKRICVQVTSTADAAKIHHTLDRFFAHGLEKDYDRLIVLILGKMKKYRSKPRVKEGFSFDLAQDVWDIGKLLTQMAGLPMPQLRRVDAYLREQFDDLEELEPPLELPVLSALDDKSFLGRDKELDEIARRFEDNERFVFLSGLGGMGKTELAVRFSQTRWGGESYFVHYSNSWQHTVLEQIVPRMKGLNPVGKNPNQIYWDAMSKLKSRGADELLIVDNVDQQWNSMTELKRELSQLNMRILITTRSDTARAVRVDTLHRTELLRLFEFHESAATPEERTALINAVDGHTLTVDLMARALRPGRRAATAEKLLRDLSDNTIRKVETAYSGGPAQARIIEHLKVVFRVTELEENEKELLRYAALMPDGGMADSLFLAPVRRDAEDELDHLIDHGWLQWKDGLLLIHPVVRRVCLEELKPNDGNCGDYLNGLIGQYDETDYRLDACCQMAETLTNATTFMEDPTDRWAVWAARLWRVAGNNYRKMGNSMKAREYLYTALVLREKVLPIHHPDIRQSCRNVYTIYDDLENSSRKLEFQERALAIEKKILPLDHSDIAGAYYEMAWVYHKLGDFQDAARYMRRAADIVSRALPEDHPDRLNIEKWAEKFENDLKL